MATAAYNVQKAYKIDDVENEYMHLRQLMAIAELTLTQRRLTVLQKVRPAPAVHVLAISAYGRGLFEPSNNGV
jgi:hypothetical protein